MNFNLIVFLLFCWFAQSQKCLDHTGKEVDWFVILITPGSVSESYLYFDSNSNENFVHYLGEPDRINHPIHNTFTQLSNSTFQIIAWNDQLPNGSSSSARAHSKTVVGYNLQASTGIFVVHSMPLYPAIKQKTINETIDDSQSVYGQHFFCFNTANKTQEFLTKASIINPYTYSNTHNDNFTMSTSSLFEYSDLIVGTNNLKAIFKNGKINGSIFQDGLTEMLQSSLIAQTWGRPIMAPWCGNAQTKFKVGNSAVLGFDDTLTWKQTQDHSKWALPVDDNSNYACFGDMNRMQSQFKRGGAFYCIESKRLKLAMKKLLKTTAQCA